VKILSLTLEDMTVNGHRRGGWIEDRHGKDNRGQNRVRQSQSPQNLQEPQSEGSWCPFGASKEQCSVLKGGRKKTAMTITD